MDGRKDKERTSAWMMVWMRGGWEVDGWWMGGGWVVDGRWMEDG